MCGCFGALEASGFRLGLVTAANQNRNCYREMITPLSSGQKPAVEGEEGKLMAQHC